MRLKATEQSNKGKWVFGLVVVVSLYFVVSLVRNLMDFSGVDQRVVGLENEVGGLRQENQRLADQMQRVESGDYAEVEIRDKLGLVKPGESVVVLPQDYFKESQVVEFGLGQGKGVNDPTEPQEGKPNWQKWMELFL